MLRTISWLICFALIASIAPAHQRTDNKGQSRIAATQVAVEDGKARLKRSASKSVSNVNEKSRTSKDAQPSLGIKTQAELEILANKQSTIDDILTLYHLFLSDPKVDKEQKSLAKARLTHWEKLKQQQASRAGQQWIVEAKFKQMKKDEQRLLDDAMRLADLDNRKLAEQRLMQASKANPDGIRADFFLGVFYAIGDRNAVAAEKHFRECVKRRSINVEKLSNEEKANLLASINNLALAEIRQRKFDSAVRRWKFASTLAPPSPEIVQNVGRLAYLAESNPRLGINKDLGKRASNLYTDLAAQANARQFEKGTGWLYMGIFSPPADPVANVHVNAQPRQSSKRTKHKQNQSADNSVVVGSASSFVVHPHYLITNFHVVDGADRLTLSERGAPDHQYEAKVIAESKQNDLALLRCDELTAAPIPLCSEPPRLASDIILLGYPQSDFFGLDLKATRGSIAGLPDPQTSDLLLYDVVSNPGNSGGPTCDPFGRAVAVHSAGLGGWGKLGGGVPASKALEFVKQSIPDYQELSGAKSPHEWADLVENLGKSTIFVRVWQKPENIEIIDRVADAGQPPDAGRKWSAMEDPWCTICYGRGTMKCPGGCSRGSIPATRNELIVVNPGTGQSLINSVPTTAPCKTCGGDGLVPCTFCSGGIDHTVVGH